ncbi:DNA polymerase I [Francisella tularensis]|uniref:DNA polymerase I n=3 Tax=Francisella tularensis TaxID=263 RepID=A0AAI8FU83_FRATH|nr:DNA polymerase I [Francisella tularensis]AFX71277.1 DNA polymerase I [Francisella tularensis subsp. holarctica F92]EBA53108.1 DNA polymerase I [Francisella tularensis subsp. holarctica 257]ABO46170.1 multifunctional DNA polymerase I [Francisella tularensis subsp. tularensis WY96-3418]ABU62238.1 multifunctional DNA polymerase I [Francisella tularensis subsp. holarctica FTNF002-00]AJI59647.1 DNA polymerase I [Francisella tularensis subsp. holarctica LVS]
MKKIVLVDGSSYLFRAYHALPHLTNSQGEPTGAIIGVINMLKKLPIMYDTEYVAVVFDAKGKNFRHQLYPQYKAHRKDIDDELRVQIQPLHQIIEKMGFAVIIEDGVEADDVIGTLAQKLQKQDYQIIISTGDKDMAQLVTDNIVLYDSMKNVTTDVAGVLEKYQISPHQMIDYLALMGDSSDNIPGIPKVGPKTAVKWLQDYQNIDGIIANQQQIKGKVGENLRNNIDLLKLSYQLATIKCDLELDLTVEDLKCKAADKAYLIEAYTRYEFKSLLKDLDNSDIKIVTSQAQAADVAIEYITITTQTQLDDLIAELEKYDSFAFDTETDSLNTYEANLVGLSFCAKEGRAFYIPLQHRYLGVPQQLELGFVLDKLKPLFADSKKVKVAHNFKFDEKVLSKYAIEINGKVDDTMIMAYVLKSSGKHDMDSLSKEHLGIEPIAYTAIAGTGKQQQTLDQVDIEIVAKYAAEDADITFRLFNHFKALLEQDKVLFKLYCELEMPLTIILNQMEKTGVKIDATKLIQQSASLETSIKELESKCYNLAGQEFNLSSPVQLREILFEKLGLPPVKKTAKGQVSTSEEVLVQLAEDYEIAALIMKYRHLSKLKNTYTDKLPKMLDANGRVHTSYNQTGTVTGRLSSSDPNLQNIPIKSPEGRKIREAFIAEDGYCIVAADYSQIELRIMAHLSKDKNLLKVFNQNLDIHSATAAEVLGISIDEVSSEQRRKAKAINFGLIYGMSAFGLARQLEIPRAEAQEYIDIYFNRYPSVKEYMTTAKEFAKQNGYVETILGRRLYLPEINSKNVMQRNAAERAAINAPMQGTAADIIKKAMINVNMMISQEYNSEIKMVMQVHDELVFEVKKTKLEEIVAKIKSIMEAAVKLNVPLEVNVDSGKSWDQAH